MDVDHEARSGRAAGVARSTRMRALARVLGRIIYWVAVVAVSLVILVLLIRWLESHDLSSIGGTLLVR